MSNVPVITPAEDLGRVVPPPRPAPVLDHVCEESVLDTHTRAEVEVIRF